MWRRKDDVHELMQKLMRPGQIYGNGLTSEELLTIKAFDVVTNALNIQIELLKEIKAMLEKFSSVNYDLKQWEKK